jgi:dihydrofolate reductase
VRVVRGAESAGNGFDAAFDHATATHVRYRTAVARERGVDIAGGASTVRQALAAGVIDEVMLDIMPVLLGTGERLFDGVPDPGFELVAVIDSPNLRSRSGMSSHTAVPWSCISRLN